MGHKHHKLEEIVAKLQQLEALSGQGKPVADAVRAIGVTEAMRSSGLTVRFRRSRGGQALAAGVGEAVEHEADHGEGDHRLGDVGPLLIVLRQAPPSPEPTDGSFDHPPAWQQDEALGACDAANDD